MDILRLIKHYSWESKVLLAVVSFAMTFGEFRMSLQLYQSNPLAKGLSVLKQLPELLEHAAELKPKLDALYALIREIVDVTKKIVESGVGYQVSWLLLKKAFWLALSDLNTLR